MPRAQAGPDAADAGRSGWAVESESVIWTIRHEQTVMFMLDAIVFARYDIHVEIVEDVFHPRADL